VILDSADFIMNDLPFSEDGSGISISYTPVMKDVCYNASLLGAEVLARAYHLCGNAEYRELARKACDFVISRQKDDGRWNYSLDMETGNERVQIDFHQGYVIDSLCEIGNLCGIRNDQLDSAIKKGLEFYAGRQILPDGRTKWRWPDVWPVDIHNQSQGIITLSKMSDSGMEYHDLAHKIAEWTIQNMQHRNGSFYHQVHRNYSIKIPYMRWSQAWMMLALATLLKNNR
jgi:rhamnogalacturonyl hydrolase YesR